MRIDGSHPDGRRSRWDGHRAARRTELIDAAIAAVAAHGPQVGMDRIAALAGTSKPVVYRYFADKNDLYRAVSTALVRRLLDRLSEVSRAGGQPFEIVAASVGAYLELLERSPALYRFVQAHPLIDGPAGEAVEFTSAVSDLLAAQLADHLRTSGTGSALARPWAEGIVGFVDAAGRWWLAHPDAMTRAQLTACLASLVWHGAGGVQHPEFAAEFEPAEFEAGSADQ